MTDHTLPLTQNTETTGRDRVLRRVGIIVLAVLILDAVIIAVYWSALLPWMQTWGATPSEVTASLPGDDIVPGANIRTTKGITVQAEPEAIYPWLLQLGVDRGGMYSYDWLENLFGLNVHTTDRIVSAYQDVQTGDFWRFTPEDYILNPGPGLYVQELITDQAVLLCFGMEGQIEESCMDSLQFVLVPQDDGSTRLLLRSNMAFRPELPIKLTYFMQFIMERKMLLTLRDMAEANALR